MPEYSPTEEQAAILDHDIAQSARVLAGPGTGKSATLVALINKVLNENQNCKIKLLTFTRAATAELALKVSEHPAASTLRPNTIHSFAISVLMQNPGAGNLPQPLRIADDWEYGNVVTNTLARRAELTQRKLKQLVTEMAANWESLNPEKDPGIDESTRARFLGSWNEHRQIYGYTLLAELPYALRNTLRDHPDVNGINYDCYVVDEYQDLNACDLDLLRRIAAHGSSIIAAGDDDQSIYSFRKAAPEGILRFHGDYPNSADYPLSITQRCGRRIIEWANYVIEGDPDRHSEKPQLTYTDHSPEGEVALLSFPGHAAEAEGIASLVNQLILKRQIEAKDILILLRSDYNESFSSPIKEALNNFEIPYSDSEAIERVLAEYNNRRLLEIMRLLVFREDSLAWASLLTLTRGIGDAFIDFIYRASLNSHCQFGQALLAAYNDGFPAAPTASAAKARRLIHDVLGWLDEHAVLQHDGDGWGHWIARLGGGDVVPAPTQEFVETLHALDNLVETDQEFGRFLSQITPLAKDWALSKNTGVRIMTLAGAKGLTVRATIIGAVEEGLIPRPDGNLGEERRLLFVGMTRAREYLYCTWARRRRGPTARAGAPIVGNMRQNSSFLDGGPVESEDGNRYLENLQ
jgi:DNA helicase-2/ATP-dependent DNA helicase PcrA